MYFWERFFPMLSHKDQAVGDERLLVKYVHVEVMSDEINGVGERLTAVLGKAFPETRHRHGAFYYFSYLFSRAGPLRHPR
ncbi:hypothetical protein NYE69_22065 [Paenibacillus sp. FSL R5-0527]|uniref:hypothetical protein n=1 Tax=Paenibacillus sp. FSL R5-0527 TaxID=2975321 RepID=UPI00097AC415|nr:hypothetical protein BK140_13705 [Paenibacillus macerans]